MYLDLFYFRLSDLLILDFMSYTGVMGNMQLFWSFPFKTSYCCIVVLGVCRLTESSIMSSANCAINDKSYHRPNAQFGEFSSSTIVVTQVWFRFLNTLQFTITYHLYCTCLDVRLSVTVTHECFTFVWNMLAIFFFLYKKCIKSMHGNNTASDNSTNHQ